MKTLVKPPAKLTIAIARNKFTETKIELSHFKKKKYKFDFKIFLIAFSFLIFFLVPEAPQELSSICNENYSAQVCTIW